MISAPPPQDCLREKASCPGAFVLRHLLLCPWDSPGENTEVGCHFLLPNTGIKPMSPMSPALAGRFFTTEPPRKPWSLPRLMANQPSQWFSLNISSSNIPNLYL